MNRQSRTGNSLRNFYVGVGAQLFQYALSFATRTVFIMLINIEYLGVNGLFTNVLTVLSLAEMGVGGAFISLLYKPLHEKDIEKLKSLTTAFRKAYTIIGIVVGVAGLALYPFLDKFIKENNIPNLHLIYLMFLAGSVMSYFYAHKISFLNADQKLYITTIYTQVFVFIQYILQIIVLLATRSFIIYLTIQILCPIVRNFILARKINRLYPFLKEKGEPLDQSTLEDLKRKVAAAMFHHFGYVIVNGTDSIVISTFLGVYWVGIYSNYLLIIGVIASFVDLVFRSVIASVGNLAVSSESTKSFKIFQRMQFMNFSIVGFSSVCLITLFNPFITLWIGAQYILEQKVVIIIVIMFYIGRLGMQKSINTFKNTTGLFYNDRYFSLIEGLLNLLLSLLLVQRYGLVGVFIGTIFALLATRVWTEAYIVFKYLFDRPLYDYYIKYLTYGITTILTSIIVYFATLNIPHNTWIGFFGMAAACALSTAAIFALLFYKTEEFKYFYAAAVEMTGKLIKRKT